MPTQQTTYNSRVTDEALEKKFRDTFKSQGGAELVDDLYAQGVIVPIVDFTAAAQGSELRSDLQRAWDFSTGFAEVRNQTTTLISNTGFWKVNASFSALDASAGPFIGRLFISDGATNKNIFQISELGSSGNDFEVNSIVDLTVFLRAGDFLRAQSTSNNVIVNVTYRQIADVSGNFVNPLGFTSS